MSSLTENPECPACKSRKTMSHCNSHTCGWSVCKMCTTKYKVGIFVFDVKNRTMHSQRISDVE